MNALIYAAGVATGAGLLAIHQFLVRRAEAAVRARYEAEARRLRAENARMRADGDSRERAQDCADAYRRGLEKGRTDPASDAERFARTFEGRRVRFKAMGGDEA